MPTLDQQTTQLEEAISRLEAQRAVLGDAVADLTLTTLRAQLATLRAARAITPDARPDRRLALLQSYLPRELADKMRATGRIEGERKQVTVLFADMSGFTALSERLDPEEVTDLTNEALQELAEAVYQYEGYIDKFLGDAVMAVFGAPVAHEDDPERALRAALAMRERLEGFNRRWAGRLAEPLTCNRGQHRHGRRRQRRLGPAAAPTPSWATRSIPPRACKTPPSPGRSWSAATPIG